MTLTLESLVAVVGGLAGLVAIILQYRSSNRGELSEDFDRVKAQRDELRIEVERLTQIIIELRVEMEKLKTELMMARQRVVEMVAEVAARKEQAGK